MANICLGNLLPSSVLAYDNIDLIPNGYIPVTGTTARPRTRNTGNGIISERETVKLLPADRLYAEFWYGVSSRITGTNLGDLGNGVFETLGFLGAGAGAGIGGAIACSLIGDSERTTSRWVFHVTDAESRLNREITLTQENITSGTITLPDYVIAVLGVTRSPIVFVTPTTPLTTEQIARAKATPAEQVESILGRRVSPSQMTDSDMRLLLGIPDDLNELENLGNSQRGIRGWSQSPNGQIQAEFKNYKYSDPENLFVEIARDERKNRYRADNEYDRADGHCFWNGSTDDLTDNVIRFNLQEVKDPANPPPAGTTATAKLKAGDKVYVSYSASIKPIFRHATENITNFFLFPDQSTYQLPPLDLIKGWNFKSFKFKVRNNVNERCLLSDIVNDNEIQRQINEINNRQDISATEKTKSIASLKKKIVLTDMNCQRLIESKLEKANRNTFIKGCYFADSRGIFSVDLRGSETPVLLIARSAIRDQVWFNEMLVDIQKNSSAFNENGEFLLSESRNFFDDFLFDISDHVNSVTYDNEKYGYERRFAKAISKCKVYNKNVAGTGVGIPNLDLVKNKISGRNDYDLTSAKFESIPMQGSASLFACNITFTYDFGFCTKGTIRADMLLRTPTFFDKMTNKARIYVEKFQAQNPLRGDGAIWVGTKSFSEDKYTVTNDPKNYYGCLVYSDAANESTNFRVFEDGVLFDEFGKLKNSEPKSTGHSLATIDSTLTQESIKYGGYDGILGDQPGYFKGTEITMENALILMGKIPTTTVKIDSLTFTKDEATGRLIVNGISNRRLRKITINYIPLSKEFLSDERLLSFIFPGSKTIIDNIGIPYQGIFKSTPRIICVDTRYINFENWFIDGSILKNMHIISIYAETITEEDYQKYKIKTSVVSSCFDKSGNWLVFYEDENGGVGDSSSDGSYLDTGISPALPGLEKSSNKEISCLFSPDYGDTWYDFKAIVRTVSGDIISSPYAIVDTKDNVIHLFYVLNDILMHKIVYPSLFKYNDAFLGYKRPVNLSEKVVKGYGLRHFTTEGIAMRESFSSVVFGNLNSNYLVKESQIVKALEKSNRTDYRILVSGDKQNYESGFPEVDFIAYKDSTGQLKVIFVYNGKLFCRGSSDNGDSWHEFIKEGMLIHKNGSLSELKRVALLGHVIDLKSHNSYLTYQVDGMLFIRKFESESSITSATQIKDILNPDTGSSKPVFVVGSLSPDLKVAIKNKEASIIFPYKDIDVFGESFSISETPSLGYSTSNGLMRLFYKDASGNFRAFSYPETPVLDINYGKI